MKHRFLLHSLNHSTLVIDITEVGMTTEIKPRTGKAQMLPAVRFTNWQDVEQYFRANGANQEMIEQTRTMLRKIGFAAMTVI